MIKCLSGIKHLGYQLSYKEINIETFQKSLIFFRYSSMSYYALVKNVKGLLQNATVTCSSLSSSSRYNRAVGTEGLGGLVMVTTLPPPPHFGRNRSITSSIKWSLLIFSPSPQIFIPSYGPVRMIKNDQEVDWGSRLPATGPIIHSML